MPSQAEAKAQAAYLRAKAGWDASQEEQSCAQCGATGAKLKRCKACYRASYCGKECARLAWPTHKKVCGKAPQIEDSIDSADPDVELARPGRWPTYTIGLPAHLTGYPEGFTCPVEVPAWMFETDCAVEKCATPSTMATQVRGPPRKCAIQFPTTQPHTPTPPRF